MIRKMFALLTVFAVMAFAAEDPVAAVKKKDAELQALLKKSSRNAKEIERVKSLLNDSFDFALLAKKSLAKGDWEKQDAASIIISSTVRGKQAQSCLIPTSGTL